MAEVCRKLHR